MNKSENIVAFGIFLFPPFSEFKIIVRLRLRVCQKSTNSNSCFPIAAFTFGIPMSDN